MPLESASNISGLVSTNPADTDNLGLSAAHIRLIKGALLATFPNVKAALTGSDTALNGLTGAWGNGSFTIPAPGTPTGGTAPAAGVGATYTLAAQAGYQAIVLQNYTNALNVAFTDTTGANAANVMTLQADGVMNLIGAAGTADYLVNGKSATVPVGGIIMWSGALTALPPNWQLCDGTNGTPDLRDRFIVGAGLTYASGNEGGSAGGTATTSAAGAVTLTASSDQQGSHSHTGQTGGTSLSVDQIPAHTHTVSPGLISNGGADFGGGSTGYAQGTATTGSTGSGAAHTHPISTDGLHAHNITVSAVPNHAHVVDVATIPPYFALSYIMRMS